MTAAKQQLARELVATHLGKVLSSSPRRTTIANSRSGSKDAKPSNQTVGKEGSSPMLTRSTPNSPRKSFTSTKGSKSSRQLKTTGGGVDSKSKGESKPDASKQEPAAQANTEAVASNGSETALESASTMNHRKKLVHEVFEGGELLPTKRGLVLTPQVDTKLASLVFQVICLSSEQRLDQLIHGVSMLLENLSRKGKPRVELNELLYPIQGGSPRRSPTRNRPLYPYAKVHMSHIPQTQQIPTSTFPALISPSKDKERRNRSESTGGTSPQSSFPDEGYQLPHRLTKSAGPRPFNLVHSSICALRGSIPFPDPAHVRSTQESEGNAASLASFVQQRPVRPHSSPAGPRFMSPRAQDLMSSASSLHRPEKFAESQADI
ncbi:hypothetical protein GQ600_22001 [Phytophthora cactorum]|nr:hypothetical protein GQ600_22001 [Phytophthora cactorum]